MVSSRFWAARYGLLFLLLLLGLQARAQAPAWQTAVAAATAGTTGTVTVQASTLKADGTAVYLVGSFSGTAVFGATTLTTTNPQEAFVARWNVATSTFGWAIRGTGTGTGSNSATAVSAVNSNSVFVTGNFTNATWQLGTQAALTNVQAGTSDIFFARLTDNTASATVNVSRRAGGPGNDFANAVLANNSLITYVGGSTSGNATFGTYTVAGAGGFMVGYGNSGTPTAAPVPMGSAVTALAYSPFTSGLYAVGNFSGTGTFVDASHTLSSAGSDDIFVVRLGGITTLTYTWAQRAGGPGADYARAVLPTVSNSVYVAGSSASASATYGGTTLTNAGGGVAFVTKLADTSTAGTFAWAVQNGGGTNAANSANALAATGTSVYVAGAFGGTATFGGSSLSSAGGTDALLAKLTDSGSSAAFVWGQQGGGAGTDYATGLVRLGTRLYVSGPATAPATFGSLSLGTASGPQPSFVATLVDTAPQVNLVAPNIGPVGTTVALYGLDLTGTTAVTFAGTSNNVVTSGFTVNAAGTAITGIVVPSGAQTGIVTATNALGTSNGLVRYQVLPGADPNPAWQNVNVAGSASNILRAQPDASGNVVVAGYFSGTLTLGATTLTSAGATDLFVAKYSPATNTYVWAQRAGGNGGEYVLGLAVQGSSIYVAGEANSTSSTYGSIPLTSASGNGSFVAKLTDAGSTASFVWAQSIDDGNYVFLESLAVSGNSVYIGGDYTGTTLTIAGGTLTGQVSGDDGFIAKLTDNGSTVSFNWAKGMSGANGGTINVYGIVPKGNTVYLAGNLYDSVTLGSFTLTEAGAGDVAVVRLLDAGNSASFTGAVVTGGTGGEFVEDMVGGQGNALYLSGGTYGNSWPGATGTTNGLGLVNGYVAKVTDTGTTLAVSWVQLLNSARQSNVYQLAVNGPSVYATGFFAGPATFGGTTLPGAGNATGFVTRLVDAGSSASFAWVQSAGGYAGDVLYAVALTPGKVYAGGEITPNAAFGPQAFTSPLGVQVAALGSLNDASVLAAAPAATAARPGLYPNPAHGTVTVQLPAGGTAGLTLFDSMGREMRRYPAAAGAEVTLDLQGVPAGLYVLRGAGSPGQKLAVE